METLWLLSKYMKLKNSKICLEQREPDQKKNCKSLDLKVPRAIYQNPKGKMYEIHK